MHNRFIITGTSRGLGYDLAMHYLSKGVRVAGCSRGASVISHPNYIHYSIDVSDSKSVTNMVNDVYKQFGGIDVLVNNAGVASMNHLLLTSDSTVENIFKINYFGSFYFTREVARKMRDGRIINFSTIATKLNLEGECAYVSSKAAVEELTRISSKELSSFATVNAIAPTLVKTNMTKHLPQNKIDGILNKQTIKRFTETEDVVKVIDFFIDHSFVTGQIVYLGGIC